MREELTGKACTVEESPTVECEAEKETMPASTMKTHNEPLGAEGPPLVGEEVRKEYVGKVGS